MTVPQPTPATLRAVVTTFAGLAIISTLFRLGYRYRIRRFWLDDGWAAASVLAQFVLIINLWIRTDTPDVGPLHQSREARVVAYWLVSLSFTCTLWAARMSQLFSVIRIIPAIMKMRKVAYALAGLFGAMWVALLIQKVVICRRDTSWYHMAKPQCHLGHAVASTELTTDFISDTMLVVVPLKLLWGLSMEHTHLKLLIAIFSASILTTIVSAIHAYFVLGPSGLLEATTANVEASVSLVVANLAVIVTYLYRLIKGEHTMDSAVYVSTSLAGSSGNGNAFGLKRLGRKSTGTQGQISALRFGKDSRTLETTIDDGGFVKSVHPMDDDLERSPDPQKSGPHVFITRETFMSVEARDVKSGREPL